MYAKVYFLNIQGSHSYNIHYWDLGNRRIYEVALYMWTLQSHKTFAKKSSRHYIYYQKTLNRHFVVVINNFKIILRHMRLSFLSLFNHNCILFFVG